MGGGLCRSAEAAFTGALPLALSISLPVARSFVQSTMESDSIDPFLPSHVSAFLSSSFPLSLSSPSSLHSQRSFALSLFQRYHHPPVPTLSEEQLTALVHDLLLHSIDLVPSILGPLFSHSLSHTRTLLLSPTRSDRLHLQAVFTAHQRRTEQRLTQWLHSVKASEVVVAQRMWRRLSERGQASGGVTEAVFVEGWAEVSEEVMGEEGRRMLRDDVEVWEEEDGGGKVEASDTVDAASGGRGGKERRSMDSGGAEVSGCEEESAPTLVEPFASRDRDAINE